MILAYIIIIKMVYRRRTGGYKPKFRRNKGLSFSVCKTIAAINNVQASQATVQAILAAHFPGAATGWQSASFEVMTGNGLTNLLSSAYTIPPNTEISAIVVKCVTESSLNAVVAYKASQGEPYRVVSGTGKLRAYFKYRKAVNGVQAPNHIVLISEGTATFRFKFYLKRGVIRSVL